MNLPALTARARVLLRAAPTYLTGAAVVLTIANEELASVLPAGTAETVGTWAVRIVAWLGAAVLIVRRVTPVIEHGLLPEDG